MNFGPKVGPLVAEFLSGLTALFLGYFLLPYKFDLHYQPAMTISAFGLIAWILGSFIDAFRNLAVESLLDKYQPIEWKFFVHGNKDHVAGVEEYFFSFYRIDMDMAFAILLFLVVGPFVPYLFLDGPIIRYSVKTAIALVFAFAIFVADGLVLRSEVRKYAKTK